MKTLIIILGIESGSKIPKIYSRFLLKKPLILYTIDLAKQIEHYGDLFVLTDDENIAHICEINNVNPIFIKEIFNKPIKNLTNKFNQIFNYIFGLTSLNYETILILNPHFPLVKADSVNNSLKDFYNNKEISYAITVKESKYSKRELWYKNEKNEKFQPLKVKEINNSKQIYERINAFSIFKEPILPNYKINIGEKIKIIKLDFPENLEVKNHIDWWIIEKFLKRKKILIRVDGYREIGFGHIYRMITLANRLIDHELLFVSNETFMDGIELIKNSNYPVKFFQSDKDYFKIIENFNPDIVLNDILDTDQNYIQKLKDKNIFVVNFEDLGKGAENANLVINALYERKNFLENHYWGKEYYILREEFHLIPKKKVKKDVTNILITFGGTDPNNYTLKILKIINGLGLENIKVNIILGLGYKNKESLLQFIKNKNLNVLIKQDVKNISKYMHLCDLIFTSAGRTVYEIASIGTPTIILCQNERELHHTFAIKENGLINLGLGYKLSDKKIEETILNVIYNNKLRVELNKKMLKNNLKLGASNVISLIYSHYEQFKSEVLS